ncbi:MAG: DUF3568 family protein [Smithella sp.]
MKRKNFQVVILLLAVSFFCGCVPIVVGGAAVGASTGTYFFIDGELKTDYNASYDKVWTACEKTIADMRGIEVVPVKEIAQGKITTIINNEKAQFDIKYKSKNLTTVGIRVGLLGNKLSSQLLHDKIAEHLVQNNK